ncbi:MAG TPA: YceI family protein [Sphingobacteriaceae bacterium]|nr:YceI family protein [Sphingobacteriaceae bacterium]
MKKVFLFLAAGSLFLASCVGNPEGQKAETTDSVEAVASSGTELAVDTEASKVAWLGKKVSGEHFGEVQITSGTLVIAEEQIVGGDFVFDLTTIDVQDMEGEYKEKLETHLKSDDFFDVANHPEAAFEITSVEEGTEANTLTVSGNLTIRGVTKNITFTAEVIELSETSAQVTADFNIAREDWGVNYAGQADDLISKEINFKITLVAGN